MNKSDLKRNVLACCRTKFDCKETEDKIIWYVRQETTKAIMETQVEYDKSKMLLVNYCEWGEYC